MRFMNEEHEEFYNNCVEKAHCSNDPYRKALFYTLGLTQDCREGINSLYDFEKGLVKQINGEGYGWITGTDIRIIRLAYHLFNNGCPTAFHIENAEEKLEETEQYLISNIFSYLSSEMVECAFEGIRIRYELV